eukprot:gene20335-24353_t
MAEERTSVREVVANGQKVIDKLTEKITERLREELRGELKRETADAFKVVEKQGKRFEGFLASEIESHTCPICYELMLAPVYSPTMLFPCGHTFCASCLKAHTETHHKGKCPLCRQKIASKAVNHSLQEIIQNFANQRERLQDGGKEEKCKKLREEEDAVLQKKTLIQRTLEPLDQESEKLKILLHGLDHLDG